MAQRVVVLHRGSIVADGDPKNVFSNVDLLHRIGLAAPETVELCYELNKAGFDLPLDQLDTEECAQTLFEKLKV
jgi:energy-coupling factor transport system ATP-binding protein